MPKRTCERPGVNLSGIHAWSFCCRAARPVCGRQLARHKGFFQGTCPWKKYLNEWSIAGKPVGADDLIGPGGLGDRAVALTWKTLQFAVGASAHGDPRRLSCVESIPGGYRNTGRRGRRPLHTDVVDSDNDAKSRGGPPREAAPAVCKSPL